MGRAASKLTKPLRTFNIENKASRVLQKQQEIPKASPKHPSTQNAISQFQYENPDLLEKLQTKNEALHENLKKLHVETPDRQLEIKSSPSKPLPVSRKATQESDLGAMDIDYDVPEGRADLKTILGFISMHQVEPEKFNSEVIASEHKLDQQQVMSVLRHFKALKLYIPQALYDENPKLRKIVEEQLSVSSSTAPPSVRLPKDEQSQSTPKQLDGPGVNTDPSVKTS